MKFQLLRFGLVGFAGYVVDSTVLYGGLFLGLGPAWGRLVSFLCAVSFTWLINRRFTFSRGSQQTLFNEALRYFSVMLIGGFLNFLIYGLIMNSMSYHLALPAFAVAVGALVGMSANFLLIKYFIYKNEPKNKIIEYSNITDHQSEVQYVYAGKNMLFKMELDLKNYNLGIVEIFLKNSILFNKFFKNVMDFGAGIGTLSQIFFSKTGVKPDGVELDLSQREILISRGFNCYPSIEDTDGPYDLIFTSNVLEHIEDDKKILLQLKSKLTETGLLLIYVPAFESIWTNMDDKVGHYRRYKIKDLTSKLHETGYKVLKIHYCDSLGFLLSLLFIFIGNKNGAPSSFSLTIYDNLLLPISNFLDVFFSKYFGKNIFVVAVIDYAR
jgi:putative flippase GtrA